MSFPPVEDAYKIRIRIDDEPANLDILDTAGQVLNPRTSRKGGSVLWTVSISLSLLVFHARPQDGRS